MICNARRNTKKKAPNLPQLQQKGRVICSKFQPATRRDAPLVLQIAE